MIGDALRGYLALANGMSEVTKARAGAAVRALVAQGELTAGQASALAEDLRRTSRTNRDALLAIVRQEVDRALNRAGLAGADQVDALDRRLRLVERKLAASPRPAPARTARARGTAAGKRSEAAPALADPGTGE